MTRKKKKKFLEEMAGAPARALEKVIEESEATKTYVVNKKPLKKIGEFWHMLGPGLTTGAADDDPSGIATYSQAGARYGVQLLWLAGFTFPLMAVIQEMCARIGLATGRGLAANIRAHYPRWVLYGCTALLFAANTFNIGANLGAMAKATQLLFPNLHFVLLLVFFTAASLFLQIFSTYERYARFLKYLALILVCYIFSALLIKDIDWQAILLSALVPTITFSKDQLIMICAILGTTISPYLFFWQTSQEVEEEILAGKKTLAERRGTNHEDVKKMRIDVWSGMFFSNVIMFFIITACAATLYVNGITSINSAADAAEALRPFAGEATYFLFAIGIVGTGFLAVPVLAGSASYAVAESFRWKNGLYHTLKQAHAFYGVLIISMLVGLLLNFIGIDPIKALIYSAVANGLVAPVVLVLIVSMGNSKKIMGHWSNGRFTKTLGWTITGIMILVGLATIGSLFLG